MRVSIPEIRASIELTTPAVLGGARPRQCDPYFRLRPSTVRGGLRYWFRAAAASMLWPAQGHNDRTQRDHDDAMLVQLRKLEAFVFGDTERASPVLVLPPEGGALEPWRPMPQPHNQPGLRYLGYGLFDGKGRPPERLVTRRNEPLILRLKLRDDRAEIQAAVAASLWLWTTFGGLGSRSRRGFGSMQLLELVGPQGKAVTPFSSLCQPIAKCHEEHLDRVQRGMGLAQDAIKALVATSGHGVAELASDGKGPHPSIRTIDGITRLPLLHGETDDPMDALEAAGSLMQRFRSSKLRKTPLPDYHAVKHSLTAPYRPPATVERAAFGLPLNFYFGSLSGAKTQFLPRKPDDPRMPAPRRHESEPDRLASPLLVRVHAIEPTRGHRSYGVTLVNLAGRNTTTPLLGCELRQDKGTNKIASPPGRLLDSFVDWAVAESKRQPLRSRRRRKGGGQQ